LPWIAWAATTGRASRSPACRAFLERHAEASLLLVGRADALAGFAEHPRARIVAATEVVGMDDPIEIALRKKKDSSMRIAIQQVKDGAAQAAISAGNTGCADGHCALPAQDARRHRPPAIAPQLPNIKGGATTVLDLGANVDCDAEDLLQFAVLGSALVSALTGNESPTVGLLNVGEEAIKGSETIKKASQLLRTAAEVEGSELLRQRRRQRYLQGNDRHRRL
jgi:glycerol-3-phosphate acyltransferase PlsX